MKPNKIDIIGKRFGMITVIEYSYTNDKHRSYWVCWCDCGKEKVISRHNLISKGTKSCGCQVKNNPITHNMSYTRFYNIFKNMKNRCYCENNTHYDNYGGRGISICDGWMNKFENFKDDMYSSYLKHVEENGEGNTTIDRIDNDGNYEPSNCRWATRKEQSNNTRFNSGKFGNRVK